MCRNKEEMALKAASKHIKYNTLEKLTTSICKNGILAIR